MSENEAVETPETPDFGTPGTGTPEIVKTAEDAPEAPLTQPVVTEVVIAEREAFSTLLKVAAQVAKTDFVPKRLRGKTDQVFATILQGRALGVDAMTALREIWISPGGSPELSAELQAGLVRKAGHKISGESTRTEATLTGTRGDTQEEMTVTYTLEDAVAQGLVTLDTGGEPVARSSEGKPMPWERFTEAMLWHRAVTKLVKRLFPDVLVGDGL